MDLEQIKVLKGQLCALSDGYVFFEFSIPRMGKRVDVLIVIEGVIFVIEFKVGANGYEQQAIDQAMDYALDLKNFHNGSHHRYVVPIFSFSTKSYAAKTNGRVVGRPCSEYFSLQRRSRPSNRPSAFTAFRSRRRSTQTNGANEWIQAHPTIVEAAQALYRGHSVDEISRSDASTTNLTDTTKCISEIVIESSKENRRKSICFVTGVPGAGKTLAGLNISIQRLKPEKDEHSVFLSGNGPLVAVLRGIG